MPRFLRSMPLALAIVLILYRAMLRVDPFHYSSVLRPLSCFVVRSRFVPRTIGVFSHGLLQCHDDPFSSTDFFLFLIELFGHFCMGCDFDV